MASTAESKSASKAGAGPTCTTQGCNKPGTMVCPTCTKLNIPGSYFCSQECFKTAWKAHKPLHKLYKQAVAASAASSKAARRVPKSFAGFKFTGPLRPGIVSDQQRVPSNIKCPDYADHPMGQSASEEAMGRSTKIQVCEGEYLERLRAAGKIGREVMDIGREALKVGATPDEVDQAVYKACIERNAYPSPLNYYLFPKSVCVSVNEVICHGIPDDRKFEDGDIVNLDVTVYVNGVHSDLNETFLLGNVDEESVALVKTAFECLAAAIDIIKPGTMYRELGKVIQKRAKAGKCSVVTTYCGHGCNELFHTAPNVPHYAKNKAVGTMKEGHVFTVEPMINLGNPGDVTWPDGWTAVTKDGKRSAQFEHSIAVTKTGYELLTARVGTTSMVWDEDYSRRP